MCRALFVFFFRISRGIFSSHFLFFDLLYYIMLMQHIRLIQHDIFHPDPGFSFQFFFFSEKCILFFVSRFPQYQGPAPGVSPGRVFLSPTVKLALAGLQFCCALVQLTHFSQGKLRCSGEYLMFACHMLLILERFS